jgi:hypothetical protein
MIAATDGWNGPNAARDFFMTVAWQGLLEHPGSADHIAQVYRDESFLLEATGCFVAAGLRQGDGVVLVMRKANLDALAARLAAQGVDLEDAVRRGQVSSHDAEWTLGALMKDGMPDAAAFRRVIGGVIRRMRSRYAVVRAFGEMADILSCDERRDAAAALEGLWSEVASAESFALLSAYHVDPLDCTAYGGQVERICSSHTHLIPDRDYERFDDAVSGASHDVLDESAVMMVESFAVKDKPRIDMPMGQAVILWLNQNMPRTAEKILARVRTRYDAR